MMANETPSQTKPLVLGRRAERQTIRALVESQDSPWLLWITAPAGSGKSRLLEAAMDDFGTADYLSSGLFDFFTDGLRTRDGILVNLAQRFEVYEGRFAAEKEAYDRAIRTNDSLARVFALRQMEAELIAALKDRFARVKRGLIFADTVELVARSSVGNWFFADFLPRLSPNVAVIAAGRQLPEKAHLDLSESGDAAPPMVLGGLNKSDIGDLLEARLPGQFDAPADPDFIDHCHSITDGDEGGQALLIDMIANRINEESSPKLGETLSRHEVMSFTSEQLREQLVDATMRLDSEEGNIILWMTHADHGFDEAMLRHLRSAEDLGTDNYEGFLNSLKPLPCIRFHDDTGVVRVHDYFRDRARDNVWLDQDPDYFTRSEISSKLATYFADKLAALPEDSFSPERDRLTQQWLYHLLFANRQQGYAASWKALGEAWHIGRTDFMHDMLEMMSRVNEMVPTRSGEPQVLRRIIEAVEARMLSNDSSAREKVVELADNVIGDDLIPDRIRYSAMTSKGIALGGTKETAEANESLSAALAGLSDLFEMERATHDGNAKARELWDQELGLVDSEDLRQERYRILNTMGVNERLRGFYDKALELFKESYLLSLMEGDMFWNAAAASQIGTVLRYQGKIPDAIDWLRKGLSLREQLGLASQVGHSMHAYGQLYRDTGNLQKARQSFQEELSIFNEIDWSPGIARALTELGWVETLSGNFDRAEECFQKASELNINDIKPSLSEKYGRMLLSKAMESDVPTERESLLDQAQQVLRQGVEISGDMDRQLYAVLCMAALVRIAHMRGDDNALDQWAKEISLLRDEGYHFDWAFAEMEEVYFKRLFSQAHRPDGSLDDNIVREAAEHFLRMFAHLAKHSPIQYREKREDLGEWLNSLPQSLREDVGLWLIHAWREQPDELAERHPGLIRTVKIACDFDDSV